MPEINLIDVEEMARRLSMSKGTLYNRVHERRIPFIKIGKSLRFDPDEVIRSLPHCSIRDGPIKALK